MKNTLYMLVLGSSLVLATQRSATAYANCQCVDHSGLVYGPPNDPTTVGVDCNWVGVPESSDWANKCTSAFPWKSTSNWDTSNSLKYCSFCGYDSQERTRSHRP